MLLMTITYNNVMLNAEIEEASFRMEIHYTKKLSVIFFVNSVTIMELSLVVVVFVWTSSENKTC